MTVNEETQERKPMEDWPEGNTLEASSASSEFEDYVKVDAGEPIKAHITAVKTGTKPFKGEEQDRMFVYFKLDEGEGEGQVYRGDFNPKLTTPDSPKQSNLSKFVTLVYGAVQTKLDPKDLIGRPIRVLLSEPWGDKKLQFVNSFLKPATSQKRIEADVLPTAEEVAEFMGGEIVDGD